MTCSLDSKMLLVCTKEMSFVPKFYLPSRVVLVGYFGFRQILKTSCIGFPIHFRGLGHSPKIDEKNVAKIEAGLMKESLLTRSWTVTGQMVLDKIVRTKW